MSAQTATASDAMTNRMSIFKKNCGFVSLAALLTTIKHLESDLLEVNSQTKYVYYIFMRHYKLFRACALFRWLCKNQAYMYSFIV